jgi:hypothetical protein
MIDSLQNEEGHASIGRLAIDARGLNMGTRTIWDFGSVAVCGPEERPPTN